MDTLFRPGLFTTLIENQYVDLPGGQAIVDQVLAGQTIKQFQKTYSELVEKNHETESKFLKEKVKLDKVIHTPNPVHEFHNFYSLKTYLCHYLKYCWGLFDQKGEVLTAEICKSEEMLICYILAMKGWGILRSTMPHEEIFSAALVKASRAFYQAHQMNEETFEQLVKDHARKPESVLIRYFAPSDFDTKDQVMLIQNFRDNPKNRNFGPNHVCHDVQYCKEKKVHEAQQTDVNIDGRRVNPMFDSIPRLEIPLFGTKTDEQVA